MLRQRGLGLAGAPHELQESPPYGLSNGWPFAP